MARRAARREQRDELPGNWDPIAAGPQPGAMSWPGTQLNRSGRWSRT